MIGSYGVGLFPFLVVGPSESQLTLLMVWPPVSQTDSLNLHLSAVVFVKERIFICCKICLLDTWMSCLRLPSLDDSFMFRRFGVTCSRRLCFVVCVCDDDFSSDGWLLGVLNCGVISSSVISLVVELVSTTDIWDSGVVYGSSSDVAGPPQREGTKTRSSVEPDGRIPL